MNVFAAPGENARSTPAWAAFLLLWAFWLVGNLATIPFVFAIMAPSLLAGTTEQPANVQGLVIIITLYVMFSTFAACALVWIRYRERRSFASAGISWQRAGRRYLRGLFWGAVFALFLMLAAILISGLSSISETPVDHFSWEVLSRPSTLMVLGLLGLGLLVQSAAEEIICRGWLLSSIAMRHGRTVGLLISAIFFGSLHIHFFFFGNIDAGLVAIISITLMGLMLGLYALNERSIIGAAGMHGAFNTLVFGITLVLILGTGEASDPLAGLSRAYELSTQPKALSAENFIQGGLALLASTILWRRLRPVIKNPGASTGVLHQ